MVNIEYVEQINSQIEGMTLGQAGNNLTIIRNMKELCDSIHDCFLMLQGGAVYGSDKYVKFRGELRGKIRRLVDLDGRGIKITHKMLVLQYKQIPDKFIKLLLEKSAVLNETLGKDEKRISELLNKCEKYLGSGSKKTFSEERDIIKFVFNIFEYVSPLIDHAFRTLSRIVDTVKEEAKAGKEAVSGRGMQPAWR